MDGKTIKLNSSGILVSAGLVAGLLAGLLTIVVPPFVLRLGSPFYLGALFGIFVGDIFGAVISVYFWIFPRCRSVAKLIEFTLASTFAYIVALYVTMFSSEFIGFSSNTSASAGSLKTAPIGALFLGGASGAFIVLIAALLLFSSRPDPWRVVSRALQWSFVGGVLGMLGWASGPFLGQVVLSALGQRAVLSLPGDAGTDYYYSLYLVWQTGMGLVLGILLAQEAVQVTSFSDSISRSRIRSPQAVRVARLCLVAIVVLALAYFARKEIPDHYQSVRWQRAYLKHVAEIPSLENLHKVAAVPADQMLILNQIGEYVPSRAKVGESNPALNAKTGAPTVPRAQCYVIRYALPGAPDGGPRVGPHVDVQVQEYPNEAWAMYELGEQGFATNLADIEKLTKFGNRILAQTEFVGRGGGAFYFWSSANRLVILQFSSGDPDEFLKEYLGRYPSSL
jgi:hypothetical protein